MTISLVRPGLLPIVTFDLTTLRMETVTGGLSDIRGRQTFRVWLGDREVETGFWLADITEDCILELDCLTLMGALIDTSRRMVVINGQRIRAAGDNWVSKGRKGRWG